MKKLILIALSVLAVPSLSFSQAVKRSVGTPYASIDASYVNYFKQGSDVLAVKANKKEVVLQKLNSETLSITSSRTFTDFPKGTVVEYATESNNRFYLVYSVNATSYVREIDAEQGSFKEAGKVADATTPRKDNRAQAPATVALDNATASIRNISTFEPNSDYTVSTGFYHKNINTSTAGGIFVLKKTNQADSHDQARTYDIPSAVINQYLGGTAKQSNFSVKEVLSDKDHNLTLISEDVSQVASHYYTPKGTARTAHYTHYDDLLITKLDAAGNLIWMKKLPKRQVTSTHEGKGQLSYASFASATHHYVIFVDNAKNANLSIDDAPVEYKDGDQGVLTAYAVSKDNGTIRKINLLSEGEQQQLKGYQFSSDKIVRLSDKSFLLEFSKKGKQDVLVSITVAE